MEQFLQQSYINDIVTTPFYEISGYPEEFKELEEISRHKKGKTFIVPENVYVAYKGNLYEVRILLMSPDSLINANYIIDIRSFNDKKLFSYISVTGKRCPCPSCEPPNLLQAVDKIIELNVEITDLYA